MRSTHASLPLRQGEERDALVATGFPITSLAYTQAEQRLWSFSFHITKYHWIWSSNEWVEDWTMVCRDDLTLGIPWVRGWQPLLNLLKQYISSSSQVSDRSGSTTAYPQPCAKCPCSPVMWFNKRVGMVEAEDSDVL